MKIETKYNIGDEVWVILRNKAECVKINNVRITGDLRINDKYGNIVDVLMRVEYCFLNDEWVKEENCFPTKEELIKSLQL